MRHGFLTNKPSGSAKDPAPSVVPATSVIDSGSTSTTSKADNEILVHIDAVGGAITSIFNNAVLVTVPPKRSNAAFDENHHTEWITFEANALKLRNTQDYPKPVPKPRGRLPAHEVKTTPNMGKGVFATRYIKAGEVVFAERPLLVAPSNMNFLGLIFPPTELNPLALAADEYEKILQAAFSRMSPVNQAAYKSLCNSHPDDTHWLQGIRRTNGYRVGTVLDSSVPDSAFGYSAVGNLSPRYLTIAACPMSPTFLNRLRFPWSSKRYRTSRLENSFFTCTAIWEPALPHAGRNLHRTFFVCECRACVNATPERDQFREEFNKRTAEIQARNMQVYQGLNHTWPNDEEFRQVLEFQATAIEEGTHLDYVRYNHILGAILLGYSHRNMRAKASEILTLVMRNGRLSSPQIS